MSELKPVVVVGSINMDLVASAALIPSVGQTVSGHDFAMHHGGKGANQAVAAGRLGYPVAMIGRVGDDEFGKQLKAGLEEAGVNTTAVSISKGSSGVALIVVSDAGENSIVVVPGANADVSESDVDTNFDLIKSAGMVLAQLEIPLKTIVHLAKVCASEGVPFMLDPAPAQKLPHELLENVTWFTPNETEAAFFLGDEDKAGQQGEADVAKRLMQLGVHGVILKLGARGAFVASSRDVPEGAVAPFPVKAVDSTAAGDCFNGAFAVAMLKENDPLASAQFAAAAAAISVTRQGAQTSMPSLAEVEEKLSERSRG